MKRVEDLLGLIKNIRPITVDDDATIDEVVEKMLAFQRDRAVYVIAREGILTGIISLGDISRHLLAGGVYHGERHMPGRSILSTFMAEKAADIMTRSVITTQPEEELNSLIKKMIDHRLKVIPVVDAKGKLLASINLLDIFELKAEEKI
ncbi:CBS domain protein [bacterium BMS3Bbin07]|nr:CBS domain protein [bacterium BMS3Bbin07]HDH02534.1 CBS domain-containing protein [Nitrospirota bacterium]